MLLTPRKATSALGTFVLSCISFHALSAEREINSIFHAPVDLLGAEDETLVPADSIETQLIARGYDSLLGDLKNVSCVKLIPGTKPLGPPAAAPKVVTQVVQINDTNSYASATEINAASAFNWGTGKAEGSVSYLYSNKISSYRAMALQETNVSYPDQDYTADLFRLNKFGEKLLALGYETFRYNCGDTFVLGMTRGGIFSATINIDADTSEEQQKISGEISASQGAGSLTSNFKNYIEKKAASGQLQISVVRDALEENIPNLDLSTLITYAQAYPTKIGQASVKPVRSFRTSDYLPVIIASGKSDPHGVTPIWAKRLASQFTYLLSLTKYNADLTYLRDHPQQFVSFDPTPVSRQITAASTVINRIKGWAVQCVRTAGKDCDDQSALNLPVPGYSPQRAEPWIMTLNPAVESPQLVGTTRQPSIVEATGIWQFGNDPRALDPITVSTRTRLVNNSNPADERWSVTLTSLAVPAGFTVYLKFDDIPGNYGDNHYYSPDPARMRIGGSVANFVDGK